MRALAGTRNAFDRRAQASSKIATQGFGNADYYIAQGYLRMCLQLASSYLSWE